MNHLVTCTFNRPGYLRITLDTMRMTEGISNAHLWLYDDCSTDTETLKLLDSVDFMPCDVIRRPKNLGCDENIMQAVKEVFSKIPEDTLYVVDADLKLHPYWYRELVRLAEAHPDAGMCTAFRWDSKQDYVLRELDDCLEKPHIGGACVALRRRVVNLIKDNSHWDHRACAACNAMHWPIYCTKESYVHHIGRHGVHVYYGNISTNPAPLPGMENKKKRFRLL